MGATKDPTHNIMQHNIALQLKAMEVVVEIVSAIRKNDERKE